MTRSIHRFAAEDLAEAVRFYRHEAGITPNASGVVVMAAWSIVRFKVLPNYRIEVSFADGTSAVADLGPRVSQGQLGDGFDPLCDEAEFAKAFLEHGALTWPGGIDPAPDAMYQRIRESGISILAAKSRTVA